MNHIKQLFPLALLCLLLAGCGPKAVQKEIFAMDTVMSFTAYGEHAEQALNDAVTEINQIERELDPELDSSTVYQINHAEGQAVDISEFMFAMTQTAQSVSALTDGALDLTVYPAVKAWGFVDGQHTVPTQETLDALKPLIDSNAISCQDNSIRLPAGMALSYGAVAKGAASDRACGILRDAGVESAIISLGGNVQTLGMKPDCSNWNVAVQDPNDPAGRLGVLSVGESAVVTSGSYQRYFEQDGKVYHHILDPHTLAPADSGLVSVTIVCGSGTLADCLSTALFVLDEDGAIDYWRGHGGFDMLLVTEDNRVLLTENLTLTDRNEAYQYEIIR